MISKPLENATWILFRQGKKERPLGRLDQPREVVYVIQKGESSSLDKSYIEVVNIVLAYP